MVWGQQHEDTCMGQMSSMGGLLMNDPMQVGVCDSVKEMGSGDLTGENTKGLGSVVAGRVRNWKKQARVKKGLGGSEGVGTGSLKKRKADESEQGKHMTTGGKKARKLEGISHHAETTQAEAVVQPHLAL